MEPTPTAPLDRNNDRVYDSTTAVVRAVMALSQGVQAHQANQYLDLVKKVSKKTNFIPNIDIFSRLVLNCGSCWLRWTGWSRPSPPTRTARWRWPTRSCPRTWATSSTAWSSHRSTTTQLSRRNIESKINPYMTFLGQIGSQNFSSLNSTWNNMICLKLLICKFVFIKMVN